MTTPLWNVPASSSTPAQYVERLREATERCMVASYRQQNAARQLAVATDKLVAAVEEWKRVIDESGVGEGESDGS